MSSPSFLTTSIAGEPETLPISFCLRAMSSRTHRKTDEVTSDLRSATPDDVRARHELIPLGVDGIDDPLEIRRCGGPCKGSYA